MKTVVKKAYGAVLAQTTNGSVRFYEPLEQFGSGFFKKK
jgi:hypothetical protein